MGSLMGMNYRQVLDQIDEYLADPAVRRGNKEKLWDVLTALRGPDDDDEAAKHSITVNVRVKALPRSALAYNTSADEPFGPILGGGTPFDLSKANTHHFRRHASTAATALNISEGDVVQVEGPKEEWRPTPLLGDGGTPPF